MRIMKKLSIFTALIWIVCSGGLLAKGTPFSLLTSVVSSGDLAGGIRYTLDKNWVVDGWVSQRTTDSTRTTGYWADIYYGNWGVVLSGSSNQTEKASLAYGIEKAMAEDISMGISVKLLEVSQVEPTYMSSWDLYVVLSI